MASRRFRLIEGMTVEHRERPGWIWAIAIFYGFSAVYTVASYLAVYSGKIALTPAQADYFARLTPIDHAFSVGGALLNLSAVVLLFLLRKRAVPLFFTAVALAIVAVIWHSIAKGFLQAAGGAALVGMSVGLALQLAIALYARRLATRGVLQ
jgi:hypothetical protein